MTVLFLAKHKPFADAALEALKLHVKQVDAFFGNTNDTFPQKALVNKYDYTISYLSPWIVPKKTLEQTSVAAINLHPGPPEYPGIGCTNFALYNEEKKFGITVHHMKPKVDSGAIIIVKRFPIFPHDNIHSLSQKCYAYIFISFLEIIELLITKKNFPQSIETWQKEPYTRKQLDELCEITKQMSDDEIRRRVRAVSYPGKLGAFCRWPQI